jgi:chloramphenicol O-acetyltransferase type A
LKIIDLDTWERRTHFYFFKRMDYPHYNISVNIGISKFLARIRERGYRFFYAMVYAATYALNQVEEFRYRIRGEQVGFA